MDDTGYFWFSKKMQELIRLTSHTPRNFCELDDGRILEYTVWRHNDNGSGTGWDDIKFLGHGKFHHQEVKL